VVVGWLIESNQAGGEYENEEMGFVEMYAAHMAWTVGYGLFALTGGDFAALTVLIVGSSGVAGLVTMFVGLRKYRQEAQAQRVTGSAEIRTVAKDEAESAMRVMGDVVAEQDRYVKRLETRVIECERRCDICQTNWAEHRVICPLFGGPPHARP
jgi:hypothetical protein